MLAEYVFLTVKERKRIMKYIISESLPGAFRTLPEALVAIKADKNQLQEREEVHIVVHGIQHLTE